MIEACFTTHLEFSITYLAILILVSSGEHVLDDLVEKEEIDKMTETQSEKIPDH